MMESGADWPNIYDAASDSSSVPSCTGCKSSSPAVANCFSCSALLCANCVIAHQLMVAFEVRVLF